MTFIMRGHMLPGIKQRVAKAGVCESCYCTDCRCSPSPNKKVECAAYGGGVTKGKYEDGVPENPDRPSQGLTPAKQISKGPGCAAYGGKSPGGTANKKEVETEETYGT